MTKKVLICDDEPLTVEAAGYVAREEGYEVLTAKDGEEGSVRRTTNVPICSS